MAEVFVKEGKEKVQEIQDAMEKNTNKQIKYNYK